MKPTINERHTQGKLDIIKISGLFYTSHKQFQQKWRLRKEGV